MGLPSARGSHQCGVWGGSFVRSLTLTSEEAVSVTQTCDIWVTMGQPYRCTKAHPHKTSLRRGEMASLSTLGNVAQQLTGLNAFKLIAMIIKAARTARVHKSNCVEIGQHLKWIWDLLKKLKPLQHKECRDPLQALEEVVKDSFEVVLSCQDKGLVCRFLMGGTYEERFQKLDAQITKYMRLIPLINLVEYMSVKDSFKNMKEEQYEYGDIEDDHDLKATVLHVETLSDNLVSIEKLVQATSAPFSDSCSSTQLHKVLLNVPMHCISSPKLVKKVILKIKGVDNVILGTYNDPNLVVVMGTMQADALVKHIFERMKKTVTVVDEKLKPKQEVQETVGRLITFPSKNCTSHPETDKILKGKYEDRRSRNCYAQCVFNDYP